MNIQDLYNMDILLNVAQVLLAIPDTKEQVSSVLKKFDSFDLESEILKQSNSIKEYKHIIDSNFFINESKYGYLFRFPPQSFYLIDKFDHHRNRQYVWISKNICCTEKNGNYRITFFKDSYFSFFADRDANNKTKINSHEMELLITTSNEHFSSS